jgi:hypothetical protein
MRCRPSEAAAEKILLSFVIGTRESTALIRTLRPIAHALKQLAALSRKDGESSLPNAADAGVAHGRAGIGFALSRWADSTGDEDRGAALDTCPCRKPYPAWQSESDDDRAE